MIVFEENIIKNSLYSTEKTNYIINLAKIYREFSVQLEKTSKINLINLTRIRTDDSLAQEQKLQRKCDLFLKEFQTYLAAEKNYNSNYNTYSDKCALLDQTIRRYSFFHTDTDPTKTRSLSTTKPSLTNTLASWTSTTTIVLTSKLLSSTIHRAWTRPASGWGIISRKSTNTTSFFCISISEQSRTLLPVSYSLKRMTNSRRENWDCVVRNYSLLTSKTPNCKN